MATVTRQTVERDGYGPYAPHIVVGALKDQSGNSWTEADLLTIILDWLNGPEAVPDPNPQIPPDPGYGLYWRTPAGAKVLVADINFDDVDDLANGLSLVTKVINGKPGFTFQAITGGGGGGGGGPISADLVTGLAEAVQDIVGAMVIAGTNMSATYSDPAGTLTLASTASGGGGTDVEVVRDTIGAALTAGSNITIAVNDSSDTITVSLSASALNRANHTGFQTASTISDFSTAAKAAIGGRIICFPFTIDDPISTGRVPQAIGMAEPGVVYKTTLLGFTPLGGDITLNWYKTLADGSVSTALFSSAARPKITATSTENRVSSNQTPTDNTAARFAVNDILELQVDTIGAAAVNTGQVSAFTHGNTSLVTTASLDINLPAGLTTDDAIEILQYSTRKLPTFTVPGNWNLVFEAGLAAGTYASMADDVDAARLWWCRPTSDQIAAGKMTATKVPSSDAAYYQFAYRVIRGAAKTGSIYAVTPVPGAYTTAAASAPIPSVDPPGVYGLQTGYVVGSTSCTKTWNDGLSSSLWADSGLTNRFGFATRPITSEDPTPGSWTVGFTPNTDSIVASGVITPSAQDGRLGRNVVASAWYLVDFPA